MVHAMGRALGEDRQRMAGLAASLDALSPYRVLRRGYSITQTGDGRAVSTIEQVDVGDALTIRVSDGSLTCTVAGKEKTSHGRKKADL